MKINFALVLLSFMLFIGSGRAEELKLNPPFQPTPEVLVAPSAEEDWMMYLALEKESMRKMPKQDPERAAAFHQTYLKLLSCLLAYYQKYPTAPQRWAAVRNMQALTRVLVKNDGSPIYPVAEEWPTATWVEWQKQLLALGELGITAPDTPAPTRFAIETNRPGGFREHYYAVQKSLAAKQPVDLESLRAEIEQLALKYPEQPALGDIIKGYMRFRAQAGATADELKLVWRALANHPHKKIRAVAENELKQQEAFSKPLDITFTAVDGRKVDIKELRGKVVLIDFWATWCGPCKAELPNVVANYNKYHDKGFEVVGISLENASLAPKDTAEQTAAKLEKAKKTLMDFTAANDMPWPQYFDGKFWKNDISTTYAIEAIPAMFLLDQEGKVVSTSARGESLEREVKRLLKH